uniref:Fucosyltransferase n=1 Tax=Kryptolebias marmoratus TaxID=37003 RepID=A0A3Q3BE75_KRYMA
ASPIGSIAPTTPTTTSLFLLVLLIPLFVFLSLSRSPSSGEEREEAPTVTLLIWTRPFGEDQRLPDCWELLRVPGCALTYDAGAYPRADAVLVHHREVAIGAADPPPEPRPAAQKWIWMSYESPAHTPELWRLEGLFNLTMSYRADSDIFLPYGYLVPRAGAGTDARALPLSSSSSSEPPRSLFVAWVVSNWSEEHARVSFYRQLSRYIRVDVFGRAGRPLPGGGGHVVRLLRRYRFYLALENSQHTDYVTEKLWNAVAAGAVPVVLGPPRANYERFLPRDAFIHVDDFPSARELARYLLLLRAQPARMRRHLAWRRGCGLRQPDFWAEHYCVACRAVRRTRGRTAEVRHLSRWFES